MVETEYLFGQRRLRTRFCDVSSGQIKGECRSVGRAVFNLKKATMFFYDRIANREPKTRGGRFRREIGIEDFCHRTWIDAAAIVSDFDFHVTARMQGRTRTAIELVVFRCDVNYSAIRRRF